MPLKILAGWSLVKAASRSFVIWLRSASRDTRKDVELGPRSYSERILGGCLTGGEQSSSFIMAARVCFNFDNFAGFPSAAPLSRNPSLNLRPKTHFRILSCSRTMAVCSAVEYFGRGVRILVLFYLNRELYYLQFYGRLHYSYTCTKTRHNTLKTKIRREYEYEEVIHTLSTFHS